MGVFDIFKGPSPEQQAANEASARRQADILMSLRGNRVPASTMARLKDARSGKLPWIATLTPAELMVALARAGNRDRAAPIANRP